MSPRLKGFIDWVAETYPQVHSELSLQRFGLTLLYKWEGTDTDLQPVLVTGHYDVVPVIPGTESAWEVPPFAGLSETARSGAEARWMTKAVSSVFWRPLPI